MKFWYTRLYDLVGYDFASELHKYRNKKEDEEKRTTDLELVIR